MPLSETRILLVEDNPGDADLIRTALLGTSFGHFQLEEVNRLSAALARVRSHDIDAILLDLSLPDSNGLDTLSRMQERAGDTPIVVLTGHNDTKLALHALSGGAQDYLVKGLVDGESMARSLLFAIERRESQAKLRHSEGLLSRAEALAHVGSWEWTLLTDSVHWSAEMHRILGKEPGSFSGNFEKHLEYVHPEDRKEFRSAIESATQTGEAIELEYRQYRADGAVVFVRTRAEVMPNVDGQPYQMVGTAQDITQQKKLEQQLLFADRMVAVGTLASGTAHEINNPLVYVISNLEFVSERVQRLLEEASALSERNPALDRMRADPNSDQLLPTLTEIHDALGEASEGANRVRKIVQNLKLFSRSEEPRLGPVSVTKVVESSLNMVNNEIRHRARLVKNLQEVPLVEADESRLGQVVLNLLVNAAHAIEEGNVEGNEIKVTTRVDEAHRVVIEVQDTGRGIEPRIRDRIFDPFFTTKPLGFGTGLGLAICRGIISGLHGEIELESELGKGSTFRVLLPEADEVTAGRVSTIRPPPSQVRRSRILIVDDEPMVASTLRRILGRDHDVATLTSGREALERIQSGARYDLIFCDLMMPGVSGMDFYGELEKSAPEYLSHVVFMTGGAFTPRAAAFLDRVHNPCIEKPFDGWDLKRLIQRLLGQRGEPLSEEDGQKSQKTLLQK